MSWEFQQFRFRLVCVAAVLLVFVLPGYCYDVDLCADAYVDVQDLMVLADEWLSLGAAADINGDGIVDYGDFSLVRDDWHSIVDLPGVVGESSEDLDIVGGLDTAWQVSGSAALSVGGYFRENQVLDANYDCGQGSVGFAYTLAPDHIIGERLRFWFKGDGSGNSFRVLCYHQPSSSWIFLSEMVIDSAEWEHVVVPAQNPIYRYYSSITVFKFEISGSGSGAVQFCDMELVEPRIVGAPLVEKHLPEHIFNTWGGASKSVIQESGALSTTMHLAPIGFFEDKTVAERTAYASSVLKTISEAGKISGVQFYNHPGSWVSSHPEYLVKNQDGLLHDDAGAFTSPWNPTARQLWYDHIRDSLNELALNNRLGYVEAVEICPGLECEVSFEWGNVWAFDDYAIAAYRNYLNQLYSDDISLLNLDWGSDYAGFDSIVPPGEWKPDREHWVFTDFYRYSMLEYYVYLSNAVREVCEPSYWIALPHTLPTYPMRFYSARYPIFYAENMKRLGVLDFAQVSALDWHHKEDIEYLQSKGVRVIGEVDIQPTAESLEYVFNQSKLYGMDGVFAGVLEPMFGEAGLSDLGQLCEGLVDDFVMSEPSYTVLEDFEDVSEWVVTVGSGAISGSVSADEINVSDGKSGKFDYSVSSAVGFDYIDYVMEFAAVDLRGRSIVFDAMMPDSSAGLFQLRLESEAGGFVEYDFSGQNGSWQNYNLSIADDFSDYGSSPDLSVVSRIRIRVNGDVSDVEESGSFNVDSFGYAD